MTNLVSKDAETVAKAMIDLEALLGTYLQASDQDANETLREIVEMLDRMDAVAAAERIVAGYGLHLVK